MESPLAALLPVAAVAIATINCVAFAAFGFDKHLAQSGQRRIAENTLLSLAFWGGSPGAYAGRHVFRHKTRKQPFSNHLFTIVVIQVMGIAGTATWFLTG